MTSSRSLLLAGKNCQLAVSPLAAIPHESQCSRLNTYGLFDIEAEEASGLRGSSPSSHVLAYREIRWTLQFRKLRRIPY